MALRRHHAGRGNRSAACGLRAPARLGRLEPLQPLKGFGEAFAFRAGGFFQNNSSILPAFVRHVVAAAQRDAPEVLVDLYCGVGLFAISAAGPFKKIFGIEVGSLESRVYKVQD